MNLVKHALLLHDNASLDAAQIERMPLRLRIMDHQRYSPNLVPSDCFLSSNLKKDLQGYRYVDDEGDGSVEPAGIRATFSQKRNKASVCSSSSSSSSLNLQPVAMTERDKSRYTEGA
ncbi:hypothetical protein EVAR_99586_1 [Eumeta japonica]|uniref:Mariner Mos1 transposase n=1 Tax=Eumeta variegata TaxID=151549 RepID=A0A4C1ZFK4_EUMVA|nr:hypothetical protein EVAR_99586_1 [Eumeta japonica]